MTRSASRVDLDPSDYYDGLPAALWKPANIPSLPSDAPAELKKYTIDVNDPKKVYILHRAQRRHGFQDMVQRFENQVVYGCKATFCDTPSCFTCARRIAGKAPIRRFHDTSARTLACYLASLDNPERYLCRNPSAAPADRSPVYNGRRSKSNTVKSQLASTPPTGSPERKPSHDQNLDSSEMSAAPSASSQNSAVNTEDRQLGQDTSNGTLSAERIERLKEPKKKDNKSFIQSLYGTVSLKMLDWLSPQSLYELSSPESAAHGSYQDKNASAAFADLRSTAADQSSKAHASNSEESCTSEQPDLALPSRPESRPESRRNTEIQTTSVTLNGTVKTEPNTPEIIPDSPNSMLPSKSRTIIVPSQLAASEGQAESSDSDAVSNLPNERPAKPSLARRRSLKKLHRLSASRPITSVVDLDVASVPRGIDVVNEDKLALDKSADETLKLGKGHGPCNGSASKLHETHDRPGSKEKAESPRVLGIPSIKAQTASLLTPEIVEFYCNFMEDNGLCELHNLFPSEIGPKLRRTRRDIPSIKLLSETGSRVKAAIANSTKTEWKRFIEQSFFYVLSNPEELLRSFLTQEGYLMDSLSMWYIMLRLTRVAPTLVFDSLWMSSSRLFSPPRDLQSRYSWIPRSTADAEALGPFQSEEAARLVLINLHALIGAMPLRWENKLQAKASSWSRIFNGERRAVARELSTGVYRRRLHYYDAFTNEPALRLARRVFSGIASVLRYEDLSSIERGSHTHEARSPVPFSGILLEYIENNQFSADSATDTLLDFSRDRSLHASHENSDSEPPVVISTCHDLSKQMIEWARTVILHEWTGEAEVPSDGVFGGALAFMSTMYQNQDRVALNESDFIVEHIGARLSAMDVPVEWLSFTPNRKTLHLLDHPYLFKDSSLVDYFRSINLYRMRKAFDTAANYNGRVNSARPLSDSGQRRQLFERLRTALTKYLVLEIRRDRVLEDAFDQLWRREVRELLRPFKVRLGAELGEEGVDLGGVQQEFFRLAISEALDPNYGTFSVDEQTKMAWFTPSSLTPLWRCELIGLIVSLAVYNGLTLPVTFPQAMYRKLLGIENTEIEHIEDGWPDLAKGLTTLLEWDEEKDGSVADVFSRTYEFSLYSFGEQVSRDMSEASTWPQFGMNDTENPKEAPLVDSSNRKAYVKDYIHWLTDVSIRPQFDAFKAGFYTCLDRKSLGLFEPHVLQTVVEGVQEIDISELKRNTRYVGWSASNRTVRDFWSTVKRYDLEQKKKLLEFVTASDRVPVGGMQGLNFTLQKNGLGDSERLPTSYTCFAILLLPEYESKEMLGEKLGIAINNAKGFGFA